MALTEQFLKYIAKQGHNDVVGRNLIFGRFSLRVAREILGLTVAEIAGQHLEPVFVDQTR